MKKIGMRISMTSLLNLVVACGRLSSYIDRQAFRWLLKASLVLLRIAMRLGTDSPQQWSQMRIAERALHDALGVDYGRD